MPYYNRRTGEVLNIPQQGGQQPSGGSSFNPLSGIKQGLNLGGKFLGGTGGNILGGLGSLAGLGLAASKGSPGGIVGSLGSLAGFAAPLAQGLGLGTVGGTLGGSLAAGGSALANTLSGGLVGTAGNIVGAGAAGAGSGLAGTLGSIAGPLGLAGLLGALPFMFPRGQTAKSIKAERKIIASAQNDIRNALQNRQPLDIGRLQVTGSFTKNAVGQLVSTKSFGPELLASYLNRGFDIPTIKTGIGGTEESYVIPMKVTQGSYQAGQMSLRPNPNEPLVQMMVAIPRSTIRVRTDKTTGQRTFKVAGLEKITDLNRDRRSEERSVGRQD